jgi:hypothetical protein
MISLIRQTETHGMHLSAVSTHGNLDMDAGVQCFDRVVEWVDKKIGLDRQPVSEGEETVIIPNNGDLPGCLKFVAGWFDGVLDIVHDVLARKGEDAGSVVCLISHVIIGGDINI